MRIQTTHQNTSNLRLKIILVAFSLEYNKILQVTIKLLYSINWLITSSIFSDVAQLVVPSILQKAPMTKIATIRKQIQKLG